MKNKRRLTPLALMVAAVMIVAAGCGGDGASTSVSRASGADTVRSAGLLPAGPYVIHDDFNDGVLNLDFWGNGCLTPHLAMVCVESGGVLTIRGQGPYSPPMYGTAELATRYKIYNFSSKISSVEADVTVTVPDLSTAVTGGGGISISDGVHSTREGLFIVYDAQKGNFRLASNTNTNYYSYPPNIDSYMHVFEDLTTPGSPTNSVTLRLKLEYKFGVFEYYKQVGGLWHSLGTLNRPLTGDFYFMLEGYSSIQRDNILIQFDNAIADSVDVTSTPPPSSNPTINSLESDFASPGGTAAIQGNGFGSSPGTVTIGSTTITTFMDWNDGYIRFQVPSALPLGSYPVYVTAGGTNSNTVTLNVNLGSVTFTNISRPGAGNICPGETFKATANALNGFTYAAVLVNAANLSPSGILDSFIPLTNVGVNTFEATHALGSDVDASGVKATQVLLVAGNYFGNDFHGPIVIAGPIDIVTCTSASNIIAAQIAALQLLQANIASSGMPGANGISNSFSPGISKANTALSDISAGDNAGAIADLNTMLLMLNARYNAISSNGTISAAQKTAWLSVISTAISQINLAISLL